MIKKNDAVAYATSESNIYVNFGNSYLDKNPKGKKNTTEKKVASWQRTRTSRDRSFAFYQF